MVKDYKAHHGEIVLLLSQASLMSPPADLDKELGDMAKNF